MTDAILCDDCMQHFSFSRSDIVQEIIKIKEADLEYAINDKYSDHDLKRLRKNLDKYRDNVQGGSVPCPWHSDYSSEIEFSLSQSLTVWDQNEHRRYWKQICESASTTSCQLCECLISFIHYILGDKPGDGTCLTSTWFIKMGTFQPATLRFNVYLNEEDDLPADILMFRAQITSTSNDRVVNDLANGLTETKSCLGFLSAELESCRLYHQECSQFQTDNWLPTRILDVQLLRSDTDYIALVESYNLTGQAKELQYMALSHVWGSSEVLALNQTTLTSLRDGIPVDTLPVAYRDAVYVARSFGIRYLWVDSLCIMQDSLEDWKREALVMDQVFTNAVCTIAACDAQDSHQSLFPNRNTQSGACIQVAPVFNTGTALISVIPDWVRTVRDCAPLYKRGWVVQERFLSARLIHFTQFPFWECRRALVTETYHQLATVPLSVMDFSGSERAWLPRTQQDIRFVLSRWYRIVEIYSRCSLTNADDKLIALAGLAKVFSSRFNEPYYAGIWGGHLLIPCLLWTMNSSDSKIKSLPPITTCRAPSWSWASLNKPIRIFHQFDDIDTVMIEQAVATTDTRGNESFGQVARGQIQCKCWLFKIEDFAARFSQLTMGGQCHLDNPSHTNFSQATYFLPLAKFVNLQGTTFTFWGLFIQETLHALDTNCLRRYYRIGMGILADLQDISGHCNILTESSWTSLLSCSLVERREGLQTIIIE